MKDRLTTLAFAMAALLLAIFLLTPPRETEEKSTSLPTTEDTGRHGLKGLFVWLDNNHVPVYSLRKRFSDLINIENLSPQGNVLIISMPLQREILKSEWRALISWIDRGNTALVLGAAYSQPAWADENSCFCDVKKLLGDFDWTIDYGPEEDQEQDLAASENAAEQEENGPGESFKTHFDNFKSNIKTFIAVDKTLEPQSKLPTFDSVSTLLTKVTPASVENNWRLAGNSEQLALRLLYLPDGDHNVVMWQLEAGNGQIFLSLVSDLFDNKMLNKADNARFIANLLDQTLSREGTVIFDDYHFGLSELYDPERFFNDTRLYQTLGFIFLFWLFYVLGFSNRLAPVRIRVIKPSARDFIDAMAGFFARRLNKKTLAQELTRRLIQDVHKHRQLQDEQAAWQWLRQHPQLQNQQLTILLQAKQEQCTRLELLTNTITDIRKKIFI